MKFNIFKKDENKEKEKEKKAQAKKEKKEQKEKIKQEKKEKKAKIKQEKNAKKAQKTKKKRVSLKEKINNVKNTVKSKLKKESVVKVLKKVGLFLIIPTLLAIVCGLGSIIATSGNVLGYALSGFIGGSVITAVGTIGNAIQEKREEKEELKTAKKTEKNKAKKKKQKKEKSLGEKEKTVIEPVKLDMNESEEIIQEDKKVKPVVLNPEECSQPIQEEKKFVIYPENKTNVQPDGTYRLTRDQIPHGKYVLFDKRQMQNNGQKLNINTNKFAEDTRRQIQNMTLEKELLEKQVEELRQLKEQIQALQIEREALLNRIEEFQKAPVLKKVA